MRLVIGEDSALFRDGLARLLADAGHEIAATAADAATSLAMIRTCEPDLAILDIRMPPEMTDDGARVAASARAEFPQLGIVLLTQQIQPRIAEQLLSSGRFAYLLKDRVLDVEEFLGALQRVHDGGTVLDPDVVVQLLGRVEPTPAWPR
ncbi:response regulator [Arthrobacter alpinus]|nr:response regulator [Arthrobacter alpinus]